MRRSALFLAAALPLLNVGCEDGPNQPYSPAPPGAAVRRPYRASHAGSSSSNA